jgi:hypothetical protein
MTKWSKLRTLIYGNNSAIESLPRSYILHIDEKGTDDLILQIKALILELIGEDDSYNEMCEECSDWDDGRNELRADLRKKVEEL